MVEFRTAYYGPMDREYHEAISETPQPIAAEETIAPLHELGETVPEHDPSGRFKNIIQTTQAAIRGGAGTLQLVMMTPPESAIGGRPKAYGTEVRETLKEVALASGVNIAGVELPTALNNLSGFDYQQLTFSDEKRKMHLDEVKDAIRFAADVGRGGGVDIVSWEFPRSVNEARWQPQDEKKRVFEQEGEQKIGWLVDQRTGRTIQFRKDEVQHIPWTKEFKPVEPKTAEELAREELQLTTFEWNDFKSWAQHADKKLRQGIDPFTNQPLDEKWKKDVQQRIDEGKPAVTPEEMYIRAQLQGQINSLLGWRTTYKGHAGEALGEKQRIEETLKKGYILNPQGEKQTLNEKQREELNEQAEKLDSKYRDFLNTAHGQQQQVDELKERIRNLKPMDDYALSRSTRTYAEAGVAALREYEVGREKGTVTKPLYVGPEIGWPGYYGSHPEEFIQLVQTSRKEMVRLLTSAMIDVPDPIAGKKWIQNPYKDPHVTEQQAKELADKHIKGLFDTSHMGMWLAHFKPIKDEKTGKLENEDQRIDRFNKWYTDQVKKIADAGVVGGIQLVDSKSAAHGHLPPGEGIFPVMETAKIFKASGYSGFIVSEGHEEEKFGEGRIRMKTWQHAGANVGAGYFSGPPLRWSQVQHGYFGKTYSPMFMFGGYSPSNEFKLWSEVPLE